MSREVLIEPTCRSCVRQEPRQAEHIASPVHPTILQHTVAPGNAEEQSICKPAHAVERLITNDRRCRLDDVLPEASLLGVISLTERAVHAGVDKMDRCLRDDKELPDGGIGYRIRRLCLHVDIDQ